ncbi:DUF5961 family protein [Phenylobacterium sp.]|jgi:hypothetical protein|uniref:DUF5961 family protein n=1 Tax=Phenylobacterium sp. TaxID=1871053 RepID=UPI002F3F6B53
MTASAAAPARSFSVHGAEEVHSRSFKVDGASHLDAALQFVAERHPAADLFGEAAVMVEDCQTGERQCFRIDLGSGAAAPCG